MLFFHECDIFGLDGYIADDDRDAEKTSYREGTPHWVICSLH